MYIYSCYSRPSWQTTCLLRLWNRTNTLCDWISQLWGMSKFGWCSKQCQLVFKHAIINHIYLCIYWYLTARPFPRCPVYIYRSQDDSFPFQVHKNYHTTDIFDLWGYYKLDEHFVWPHFSIAVLSRITGLILPTTTTIPPGWGWGHAVSELFQNQVLWGYFCFTLAVNWGNKCNWFPLLLNYGVSEYRPQSFIFTTCSDSITASIGGGGCGCLVIVCSSVVEHWQVKPGVLGWIPSDCWLFHFPLFASPKIKMYLFLAEVRVSKYCIQTKTKTEGLRIRED